MGSSANTYVIVNHMAKPVGDSLASQDHRIRHCNQLVAFGCTRKRFEETTVLNLKVDEFIAQQIY